MEAQFAQPCAGENYVDRRPDDGNEVERQIDNKLKDLDKAPRGVFGASCGFAQHLDGVGRIGKK